MVFKAELVGVIMGTHIAKKENPEVGIAICVDNQATIIATTKAKQMVAQYLVTEAQSILMQASGLHRESGVTLRWVPVHKGVEGNERADEEAKIAAKGKSSQSKDIPQALQKTLPFSKAAALQAHKEHSAKESPASHLSSKE